MAPPMPGTILFGNHPIGEMSGLIDLEAAQDREVEMSTSNETERHRAVERGSPGQRGDGSAAGVREHGMRHAFLGWSAGPDQPVFGLEEDMQPFRDVICHRRRDPNAQIDEHACLEFPGDAPRDDDLLVPLARS